MLVTSYAKIGIKKRIFLHFSFKHLIESNVFSKKRTLVFNVFTKIVGELVTDGTYSWLCSEVNTIIESREKESNLKANFKIWSDLAQRLLDLFELREKEFDNERQDYRSKIDKLSSDIDKSYCINTEKLGTI